MNFPDKVGIPLEKARRQPEALKLESSTIGNSGDSP
jgi:hypothetical protein